MNDEDYGYCCYCGGTCNICSQACGSCIRQIPCYPFEEVESGDLSADPLEDPLEDSPEDSPEDRPEDLPEDPPKVSPEGLPDGSFFSTGPDTDLFFPGRSLIETTSSRWRPATLPTHRQDYFHTTDGCDPNRGK